MCLFILFNVYIEKSTVLDVTIKNNEKKESENIRKFNHKYRCMCLDNDFKRLC